MSNTPRAATGPKLEITTAGPRKVPKTERGTFWVDGEEFHLIQPKTATLARVAMILENGAGINDPRNFRAMLGFAGELIQYVDDETVTVRGEDGKLQPDGLVHGRDLLEQRLNDPHDSLDIIDLLPILTELLKQWFDRPTGSPRASSAPRRAGSPARVSRARTPSARART